MANTSKILASSVGIPSPSPSVSGCVRGRGRSRSGNCIKSLKIKDKDDFDELSSMGSLGDYSWTTGP